MNNEDKILETLNTMLTQMSSMDNRINSMNNRLDSMEDTMNNRFDTVEKDQQKNNEILLRMEQEHGKKLDALFDGYSVNYDKTTEVEKELTALKGRMDKVEFQIKYMMEPPKASSN